MEGERDEPAGHSFPVGEVLPIAENGQTGTPGHERFFEGSDWLGFGMTVMLSLAVYLFTLAPEVTLEYSGELVTAAKYAGVGNPPGHPVWTIYAWLFTKLIPFSNVAWRVGVSSAVAAALSCGLIALVVSRTGAMLLEAAGADRSLSPVEAGRLRAVSGCVAGLGFGFSNCVWEWAVVADVWSFDLLLMAAVICLMMRWFFAPTKQVPLYAGSFVYGLAVMEFQPVEFAAPGLLLLVAMGDMALGRDVLFTIFLTTVAFLAAGVAGWVPDGLGKSLRPEFLAREYMIAGMIALPAWLLLRLVTRDRLTRWKPTVLMAVCFLLGLAVCFYEPIASMTNPPMNWAYPRSAEGFVHLLSRGQYERGEIVHSLSLYGEQIVLYAQLLARDFGPGYLLAALVPFGFLHRLWLKDRGWMLGLLGVYLCLSLGILAVMNGDGIRGPRRVGEMLLTPAHLLLAIWAGCGLVLLGARVCGRRTVPGHPSDAGPV